MNVLLILHTYSPNGELGSFAKELAEGFRNTGANVSLIVANDLVDGLGAPRFSSKVDKRKLRQIFNNQKFDVVFTTNHGGINSTVRKLAGSAPIISWLVDRNPFNHNGRTNFRLFKNSDHLITSSTANVSSLIEKFSLRKENVHYMPFMTNPNSFDHSKGQDINISFVGSYFLNENVIYRALETAKGTKYFGPLLEVIRTLEDDFDVNEDRLIKEMGLSAYLFSLRMTRRHFKGAVGNMLSNRKRLRYLEAVADLNLELFGTRNLAELVAFAPRVAACYRSNYFVNTRERLVDIYDRSKIGLNINHHQATTGLGYRVFDIMCSSALLISNYQKKSDLDFLFGTNHPVPIYKSAEELREICRYYLENDTARQSLVTRCQALIGDKHTFDTRALEVLKIINPNYEKHNKAREIRYFGKADLWNDEALKSHGAVQNMGGLHRLIYQNYLKDLNVRRLWGRN